ncbi:MAG: hypothetical protein ACREFP_09920, partial [Acetobacteraceae bacterium]
PIPVPESGLGHEKAGFPCEIRMRKIHAGGVDKSSPAANRADYRGDAADRNRQIEATGRSLRHTKVTLVFDF